MLAYVFWHWKRDGVSRDDYEDRQRRFHRALNASPPAGLAGSWCAAIQGAPWANDARAAWEDWYLVRGSADLDPLNDAAVTASRQAPHDEAAAAAMGGTAGLYRLRAGATLTAPSHAAWFAKPSGWSYAELYDRLGAITARGAALWGRQMTLGPAREFCLHTNRDGTLPAGIDALHLDLRAVFPRDA